MFLVPSDLVRLAALQGFPETFFAIIADNGDLRVSEGGGNKYFSMINGSIPSKVCVSYPSYSAAMVTNGGD